MINLSIDGRKVQVAEGATVLDAAREAGVYIPTLCHHPDLSRFGGCRVCVVEIDGGKGFPPSCNTPAKKGMVVHTDTEKVQQLRKGVLELLLSEHPSSCLVCPDRMNCWESHEGIRKHEITTGCNFCPKGGRCELRRVVRSVFGDAGPTIGVPSRYRALDVDRRDPFIDRDDNLCILCGRCVRACAEQSLAHTLDFMKRGSEARVGTPFNRPLMESGCRFCGACVDACPTGTLTERVRRWEGPAHEQVVTTCPYCSVGCQLELGVRNRRVIEALPQRDSEVNQGDACVRGRFAMVEFIRSVQRLRSPLLRRNGELVEVPWDTALTAAAAGIQRAGAERAALLVSGSCTNEDIYVAHKFARDVLGTSNVDSSVRLSFGPLLDANGPRTDVARLDALTGAAAVMLVGADPDFSHPVLAQKLKKAVQAGATRLVSIGAFGTGLSRYCECEVRHAPGEESQVLPLLQERLGSGNAKAPREDVEQAAQTLKEAQERGPVVVMYGSSPMRGLEASANRDRIAELAKSLSAQVLPLLVRANDRGAMEIAAHFACRGLSALEMCAASQRGGLDLLYLIGEDIGPGKCNAGFVVVQDTILPSYAGQVADVVFPVSCFTETEGTTTNLEGRVQRVRAAADPLVGAVPDWQILCRVAEKLGAAGFGFSQPGEIMEELGRTVPFFRDATYQVLDDKGPFFGRSESAQDLYSRVGASDGPAPQGEKPNKDYPFWLVVEVDAYAYRSTPISSEVPGLGKLEPAGTVALNPGDAEALGVDPGVPVQIISSRGRFTAKAAPAESVPKGVARVVGREAEGSPASVVGTVLEPASKAPTESCAVRIERY